MLDAGEAVKVAKQARDRKSKSAKDSVSRAGPLPHAGKPQERGKRKEFVQRWTKTAAGLTEEQQLLAVRQAIEVYESLPAGSGYARHRLKVLRTALGILEAG